MGSIQTTVKVNPSLNTKLQSLKEAVEDQVKDVLQNIARDLVDLSPVDTGAYVNSHSILPAGSGGGRMKTSEGKPKGQDEEFQKYSALTELYADIDNLDPTDKVVIRNRAKHATDVEHGWPTKDGYEVYAKIKAKYR